MPGVEVSAVRSVAECVAVLSGDDPPGGAAASGCRVRHVRPVWDDVDERDLLDVRGQAQARWCVEVAAAGGHHLFFEGPPGAGKTMLAERFTALLPELTSTRRSR